MNVQDLEKRFLALFGHQAELIVNAPGRVNLIGEHIDYCGGSVLPMALDRGTLGLFSPNNDDVVRIYSTRYEELSETRLSSKKASKRAPKKASKKLPLKGHWSDYVTGVLQVFMDENPGMPLTGFDLLVHQNIGSAGLSSSASFCVALFLTLHHNIYRGSREVSDEDRVLIARACQRVENEYLGVSVGIMDPMSILTGGVLKLECDSLSYEKLRIEATDVCFAVMDTGVKRSLATSKYNERVQELRQIADLLTVEFSSLANRLDLLDTTARSLPKKLFSRFNHVVSEQVRVLAATECLKSRDWARLGNLMTASHASLRDDYEVSCSELDLLVTLCNQQPGVLGGRMTGGGFGGCAVCLASDPIDGWATRVSEQYQAQTGLKPDIFVARPGAPAHYQSLTDYSP